MTVSQKTNEIMSASALTFEIDGKRLVDDVSFSVAPGEILGIIGPNGAGKTTLLRMLSGITKPKSGSITIDQRSASAMTAKELAQNIALVPQIPGFTYGFTCLEVVMMGRYPFMGRMQVEGAADKKIAHEVMQATDVWQFSDRLVTTLSGGERQRIFLARALAQQPKIMLLDEPTANLDISHQLKVFEIVKTLTTLGISAIVAIHDISLAARYCGRLLLLNQGKVLSVGTPPEVLTHDNIKLAFGVEAKIHMDSAINSLAITVIGQSQAKN